MKKAPGVNSPTTTTYWRPRDIEKARELPNIP